MLSIFSQRDGTGREEGGGFRMGNTCIPVADSCWYMAKPIQYCKVKKFKKNELVNIIPSLSSLWDEYDFPLRCLAAFSGTDIRDLGLLCLLVVCVWWSLKAQHSENEDHGIRSHHFMGNRWGNSGNSVTLYFSGLQNHCRWWLQPWNSKTLTPWKESYDQPRIVYSKAETLLCQ